LIIGGLLRRRVTYASMLATCRRQHASMLKRGPKPNTELAEARKTP
jgi:hypothetical protein